MILPSSGRGSDRRKAREKPPILLVNIIIVLTNNIHESFALVKGYCHWIWWIIRQAPCKLISGCFLFIRPSRQTPSPCSLHPCLLSSSPSRPPPFARRLLASFA